MLIKKIKNIKDEHKESHADRFLLGLLERLGSKTPTLEQMQLLEAYINTVFVQHRFMLHPKLTAREIHCLLLAAKGKTILEIAKIMDVKISTVKSCRSRILKKLHCHSMAHAVFVGIRLHDPRMFDETQFKIEELRSLIPTRNFNVFYLKNSPLNSVRAFYKLSYCYVTS
jgi:DNA-binding CsgD family transcriptional regulator